MMQFYILSIKWSTDITLHVQFYRKKTNFSTVLKEYENKTYPEKSIQLTCLNLKFDQKKKQIISFKTSTCWIYHHYHNISAVWVPLVWTYSEFIKKGETINIFFVWLNLHAWISTRRSNETPTQTLRHKQITSPNVFKVTEENVTHIFKPENATRVKGKMKRIYQRAADDKNHGRKERMKG